MSPFARRPKPRLRERFRETTVVAAVGACLALGLLATGGYVTARHRPAAVASASSDDEIYTGSILYMPYEGRICRQFLFDNHTGRLSDNGSVDCERAAYQGADTGPKHWSFARMRVISTGFRDR
jgi:hypothetical protein